MNSVTTNPFTIGCPWENARGKVSRNGRYPWCVTMRRGDMVETRKFDTRELADAFRTQEIEAGRAVPAS